MQTSFSRVQFTWCCRCEMCKCCMLCCSQRRNVYTLREAEHVQAHTVEITLRTTRAPQQGAALKMIVQLTLSKARVSCSQERLNSVRTGAVVKSPTLSVAGFRTCTSATSCHFNQQRAVVSPPLRDPTKPLCGPVLPTMRTLQACNQALRYHAWS